MAESLTRKQRMLQALQDDLALTKETLKKMKEIEQPDDGFYSKADENIMHAKLIALQNRHEETLREYYRLTKPVY
tara:strand:- start:777 stop:1001 length:225 start_codon:yes stop_codon:yes gene_type:complete